MAYLINPEQFEHDFPGYHLNVLFVFLEKLARVAQFLSNKLCCY